MSAPEKPEVTIRNARLDDKEGILRLLERAFGFPTDPDKWDWLYQRNQASSTYYCCIAESGGEIVAHYATIPVRFWHAGKEVPGLYSLDTATDPDFQGRGLFRTLAEKLYASAAHERNILTIFPNLQSAPGFYRKLACVELTPFPVLVRPLGNLRPVVAARQRALVPVAAVMDALALAGRALPWLVKQRGRLGGAQVVRVASFGPWADALWDDLKPLLGTCRVRDASYLQWRYCESPHTYTILALDRGDGPVGFAVVGVRPWKGGATADLLELMVRPDDRAGASLLVAEALLLAARSGAVVLRTWASTRHPHRKAFRRALFGPLPARLKADYSYGVRILDETGVVPNELLHTDDWYISIGDVEYV